MGRFTISNLPMVGLKLVERLPKGDERGSFARIFCADDLAEAGWIKPVSQINHACTRAKGTVRGMHFQRSPDCEMKLVTVLRGQIWDVAIDLRAESPTFLRWHAEILSAENARALLIPEGFAHGFQSMTNDVDILYCHSAAYNLESEGGVNPRDPIIGIEWPLPVEEISERDKNLPLIDDQFSGFPAQ